MPHDRPTVDRLKVESETAKLDAETSKIEGETTSRAQNDRWNTASSAKAEALARVYNAIADLLPPLAEFLKSVVEEHTSTKAR